MNKQLLQRNDSSECLQLQDGGSHASEIKPTSSFSKKYKVLFMVIGILVVVAVCAAVAVACGVSQEQTEGAVVLSLEGREQINDPLIDMATKEHLLRKAADLRAKRSGRGPKITNCYSIRTDDNYPAARISGTGSQWQKIAPSNNNPKLTAGNWDTKWLCANHSNAFVDGGMVFDQRDKKLYVPVCGYYHISSQMNFRYKYSDSKNTTDAQYISYEVKVNRSCKGEHRDNQVLFRSYASLVTTPTERISKSTPYIGGVVKICKGGSITAHVPSSSNNPCCPYGIYQTTYLSAFLVHETTCNRTISLDYQPAISGGSETVESED